MTSRLCSALLLAVLGGVPLGAAELAPEPQSLDLTDRLRQLEAETQALRTELQWMREHPSRPVAATPVALGTEMGPAPAQAPAEPRAEEFFTLDELKGEMKKLVWTKGDFKIVPYGVLWGIAAYQTQRTAPGNYTLYVLPPIPDTESDFQVDARSTRLGIDVSGPPIPLFNCAPGGGKVEIDFQGSPFVWETRPGLMLRHAYLEVKDDDFRLLVGHTWDVISPLYPGVLSYSVGWVGGNIGYRRPQFRAERYLAWSDGLLFTAQGSLNADAVVDAGTNPAFLGEHSGWPVLEGRLGATIGPRGPCCKPIEVGVSAHVGEQLYDFYAGSVASPATTAPVFNDVPQRTWSFNVDARVPIGDRWGVQGELFTGENLSTFLGGVLQGVNPARRAPIRSRGGWVDVWYDWTPRLHTHVGYSLDDPIDADLAGMDVAPYTAGARSYNQFYFGNVTFDVTQKFLVGVEVTQWKTLWLGHNPQNLPPVADSTRIDFVAKYGF